MFGSAAGSQGMLQIFAREIKLIATDALTISRNSTQQASRKSDQCVTDCGDSKTDGGGESISAEINWPSGPLIEVAVKLKKITGCGSQWLLHEPGDILTCNYCKKKERACVAREKKEWRFDGALLTARTFQWYCSSSCLKLALQSYG